MATVPMIAPDGKTGDIPRGRMQDAIAAGFKLAVPMLAPDGITTGYIPADKQQDAMKAGFKIQGSGTIAPMTQRERFLTTYPVGAKDETLGEDLYNAAQNVGVGIFQTADAIAHPWRTAKGLLDSLNPESSTPNPVQSVYEGVSTNPGEVIPQMAGQALAGEAFGEVAGPLTRALKDKVATARNSIVGKITKTSPKETAQLVSDTRTANEANAAKAEEENRKAAQEHLAKTQEALHETTGRELKHQQEVKNSQDAAKAERIKQTKKHIEARNQAIEDRRAAETKVTAEKLKQGKIAPTQAKLENAWSDLRAGVETAREKALAVGNEKYSGVNEKLNPLPADMEKINGLYYEAAESLGETQAQPSLIKRLGTALEHDDELSYKDLQSMYSELGKELSKGTLSGDVYHAFDLLHEGIGDDMQRIANSQEQGAQLLDARNYWRRMKQTFGKPLADGDVATKTLKGAAPEVASAEETANRVRLLGSFDSRLPKMFQHIENVQRGVESLPKEISGRQVVEKAKLPVIPPRKPVLSTVVEPINPPERMPIPDRPQEVIPESKMIDMEDIRAAKAAGLNHVSGNIRKYGRRIVKYGVGLRALWDAFDGRIADLPRDFALGAAGYGAAEVFARLLQRPAIREMLTNPTPADLAQIPPELRGNLGPMLQAAEKQGIKVSPALMAVAGVALTPKGPQAQKLRQARDHSRFAHVAVGPSGHRIGSNDGETWVDTETGEPVHAH